MMNTMKKRLPDAELEVMQAVWACEVPVARAEIEEILKDSHPMAPTTLLTLLTRLSEKGFIGSRRRDAVPGIIHWYPGRTIWHSKAGASWISSAAAACPLSRRRCVTAA